jgi:hypothetical protein
VFEAFEVALCDVEVTLCNVGVATCYIEVAAEHFVSLWKLSESSFYKVVGAKNSVASFSNKKRKV